MQLSIKNIIKDNYILCSCEGAAEECIINLLLDAGRLCFSREDLLYGEVTRIRIGKKIAEKFLNVAHAKPISILRILDREKEKIVLPRGYIEKVHKIYNVCTSPEIEILVIIKEGHWRNFKSCTCRTTKASDYCKNILGFSDVKSNTFLQSYFRNIDDLENAILTYNSYRCSTAYNLSHLLK